MVIFLCFKINFLKMDYFILYSINIIGSDRNTTISQRYVEYTKVRVQGC